MRIAKKATKGKGKRWKRGESSNSNPETNKFRQKAKTSITKCDTQSKFTVDALEAHNVLMLNKCSIEDENDTRSEAESFASMWSNCSNPSFDRLLNNWQSTSMLHKEMLAVLAAVTEIIKEKGGKETETEYFATLMTTLEGIDNEEAFTATVCLINMVVRRLPSTVLKCKFSESTEVFRKYISEYTESENGTVMRCLISSLAFFLRAQEVAIWKMTYTQQLFQEILSLTTHQKPRIRKAANKAVVGILKGSAIIITGQVLYHPAASLTAKFCTKMIEETRIGDSISLALQMLNLMKDVMPLLPEAEIKTCCETILRMMTLGNVIVVTTAFKIFHNFFLNQANNEAMNCDLNSKIIVALYDHQPSVNDSQPLSAWLVVMKQAHVCLFIKNREQFLRFIPKLFKSATACWLSDSHAVYDSVEDCLEGVITLCLREAVSQIPINVMREIFSILEKCLSYQYISAWGSLFRIFSLIFEVFGPQYPEAFKAILRNLSELRESYDFKLIADLEFAVGSAVKYMGPETVLEAIPLTLDLDNLNLNRSWLLPVLRDNVHEANLELFASLFISLSKQVEDKIEQLKKNEDVTQSKVFEVLNDQIWSLLPSFCNKPKDLTKSFKVIARNLGYVLKTSELRIHVLKALRILIAANMDNDANKTELSSYAKNFLPILLRLYTSKDNQCTKDVRLSILETVRLYLSISDKQTVNEQYTNLTNNFEKLKQTANEDEDEARKYVLLDILRVFIPFIDDIESVFKERVFPLINSETDRKCQKKGYQIIEAIVKTAKDSILDQCLDLLISSFPRVSDSAKFAPLRSLKFIIENRLIPDEKRIVLLNDCSMREAINSLSINSSKTKNAALELIATIVKFSEPMIAAVNTLLEEYLSQNNVDIQNSTIQALTKILIQFSSELQNEEKTKIFKSILEKMNTTNRSVVQSILQFIKSWLRSVPKDKVFSFVVVVIDSLDSMNEENHRHFRFKIKEILTALIRKFGFEPISKFVPEKYSKMLRSIRKLEARKNMSHDEDSDSNTMRHKKSNTMEEILEDSSDDELLDDDEKPQKDITRKRQRLNTYIAEDKEDGDVLDLLGTNTSKMIVSTDPEKKKNTKHDVNIEVADDGRLIIEEIGSGKGVKRKSMDDSEDEQEETQLGSMEIERPKYQTGGKGIHRDVKSEKVVHSLGEEYRSKKAKGDMKRKGRPDPYAYVPLNPGALNKRKANKFRGQFKNIVRAAKIGAEKGSKSNQRIKRHSNKNKKHK